ncbi:PEP-CTERM sorting domain-containing protein [Methylobacillus gramineus]|uniref:PEP-CTERM sorting domain-containing protein n=1 Tax=Methylobacillus gramineus TaxID=755169 RepID=UPI001D0011A3|nr:PEP-CTERM sorting domain-containing protein [Methylobacillus gramineus]MCB5184170.1 PEP-CTERM sorting domain-containing protein [Methylobacillus gramineus]
MTLTTKLSALAFVASASFSASAFAIDNVWFDANPWGDISNTIDYAEWDTFIGRRDAFPKLGGNASINASAGVFKTSTGNLYHIGLNDATANYNFILTSSGNVGDVFDAYLKVKTNGSIYKDIATLDAIVNGQVVKLEASKIIQYHAIEEFEGMGSGYVQEAYWVWNNIAITEENQRFSFNATANPHVGLDQLALATIAVAAVPEPSTYGMMAIGLGIIGLMGTRSRRKNLG